MSLSFFLNSILLGAGLAMDAFSVSMADGLSEPGMKRIQMIRIAGCFALFQFLMPMVGWFCVRTVVQLFQSFERWIPLCALVLLCYVGGKMLWEGIGAHPEETVNEKSLSTGELIIQGIATSIDALSVGFTIASYSFSSALVSASLIAAVTYGICRSGVVIGRKLGTRLSGKASVLGGVILIAIGIEIFLSGIQ